MMMDDDDGDPVCDEQGHLRMARVFMSMAGPYIDRSDGEDDFALWDAFKEVRCTSR